MNDIDWSKPNTMQNNEPIDWSKPNAVQSNTGWGAIGRDIQALPGKAKEGLGNLGKTIGEEAPYFGESHAQDPTRAPRTHYASLVKNVNSLLNLPGTARDYLAEKEVIPQGTPSFRFPEELVPREVNEGELYKLLGLGEKRRGDTLGELIPDLALGPAGAAESTLKLAKAAPKVAKKGTEIAISGAKKGTEIGGIAAKKSAELIGKGAEKISPKIAQTAESAKQAAKDIYGKATQRTKRIGAIEAEERATKKQLHDLKKQVPESQIERAGDIQKIIDAEQTKRQPTIESVMPYVADQKEKKISELAKTLTEAKEKITTPLKEDWKKFGDSETMYKEVLEPIQIKDFHEQHGNPETYASKGLQKIINKVVGTKEHLPEHTDIIQGYVPGKDKYHQSTPLIKDYLDLYRNAREEAADWTREAKNPDRLPDEQKTAAGKAKKLRGLASDARKKLEGYLDPNEKKELKSLEHRFEHEEIPWRESGLLNNATERHATIGAENFSEALVNENYPHLRKMLLDQHPGAREAMAAYDLRGFDVSDSKAIHKLLNSDQGRGLPEQLQKDLRAMAKSVETEKELVNLRSKLTKGEIINQIHSKELKGILKNHPDLAEPFTSDIDRRTKIRELQNHLKELGMTKEEIKAEVTKFEKVIGWAKKGAGFIPGGSAVTKLAGLLGG